MFRNPSKSKMVNIFGGTNTDYAQKKKHLIKTDDPSNHLDKINNDNKNPLNEENAKVISEFEHYKNIIINYVKNGENENI